MVWYVVYQYSVDTTVAYWYGNMPIDPRDTRSLWTVVWGTLCEYNTDVVDVTATNCGKLYKKQELEQWTIETTPTFSLGKCQQ